MRSSTPREVLRAFGLAAWVVVAGGARGADYAESVSGDLSGDWLSPTVLVLGFSAAGNMPGSNVVSGTTGRTGGVVDRDYLNVVVPQGYLLTGLRVGNQTAVGGSGSFIGLAAGALMPVAPTAADATGLLGYRLYGAADLGTDILDDMALGGNGASGFTVPLSAGDYTVWIQELAPGSFGYRFNFVLAPVPEPSATLLCALGLAVLAGLLRRPGRRGRHAATAAVPIRDVPRAGCSPARAGWSG